MELPQNAYGFTLQLDTGMDLSSTTAMQLTVDRPSPLAPLTVTLDTTAIIDKKSGVVGWNVQAGDLSGLGLHDLQLTDTTPGRLLPSRIASFRVIANLS